jgi:hypothetical protein
MDKSKSNNAPKPYQMPSLTQQKLTLQKIKEFHARPEQNGNLDAMSAESLLGMFENSLSREVIPVHTFPSKNSDHAIVTTPLLTPTTSTSPLEGSSISGGSHGSGPTPELIDSQDGPLRSPGAPSRAPPIISSGDGGLGGALEKFPTFPFNENFLPLENSTNLPTSHHENKSIDLIFSGPSQTVLSTLDVPQTSIVVPNTPGTHSPNNTSTGFTLHSLPPEIPPFPGKQTHPTVVDKLSGSIKSGKGISQLTPLKVNSPPLIVPTETRIGYLCFTNPPTCSVIESEGKFFRMDLSQSGFLPNPSHQ